MEHNTTDKIEYITGEDDFVLLKKGNEYMSGGIHIPPLLGLGIYPMTTYNNNNNNDNSLEHSEKRNQVSQLFQDLAVPSGLFHLQENKALQKKYLYSKGGYKEDSSSSSSSDEEDEDEEEEDNSLRGGKKNDVISDDLFDKLLQLVSHKKNSTKQKNKSKKNKNKNKTMNKKRSISKKIIKII